MDTISRYGWLLLAGLLPLLGTAQSYPVETVTYTSQDIILPGFPVVALYQTDDGFLWASVYNHGLIRYAGKDLAFFGPGAGLSTSNVLKIVQDQRGHLWLGCRDINGQPGGITYSSAPVTGGVLPDDLRFRDRSGAQTLPHTNAYDLNIDAAGNIWAASDSLFQVYRWSGDTTLEVITVALADPTGDPGQAHSVLPLEDGTVWASFATGVLYRLQLPAGSREVMVLDRLPLDEPAPIELTGIDSGGLLRGLIDRKIIATINPETGEIDYDSIGVQALVIRQFDRETLMIPTQGQGLLLRDEATGANLGSLGPEEGLPSGTLYDALVSREGDLWIAAINGLYHLPADFRAFAHYTGEALGDQPPLLSDANVNSVTTDVWLRNGDGGRDTVTLAGIMNGLLVIPRHGVPYTLGSEDGLPTKTVMGAVQDSTGRIYLTSLADGMVCIRPDGPPHPGAISSRPFPALGTGYMIDLIAASRVFIPFVISLPGGTGQSVWAGFGDKVREQSSGRLPLEISLPFDRPINFPLGIYRDAAGYLHVIGRSGWVRSREPFTQVLYDSLATSRYLSEDGKQFFIPATKALFEDITIQYGGQEYETALAQLMVDDKLWLAVDTLLLIVDPATAAVEHAISLNGHRTFALAQTADMVWAGSGGGLYGIRKSDLSVQYDLVQEDGLLVTSNWTPNGLAVNDRGRVFQSTPEGVQTVDPARLSADTAARPVYLTRKSYTENNWGRNELAVTYAMLSYRDNPDNIYYQTRLAGYDADWSERTTVTSQRYTNLSAFLFPRTYQMEVRAVDYLGNPYQTVTGAYPVTVEPPVYFRWWAVVIYLLLLALAIRAYTRYRLQQLERELRLREADTIRRQRDEIAAKNAENETLLKEIHHRVKNNLEVVSSLLELQSATLEEGDALDAMRAGQSRVASMGLLHQKLYQGHDMATVSMDGYLRELTDSLLETYDMAGRVEVVVDVSPDLVLDVDTAVPVGLIVNELVTNSFKYAFTGVTLSGGSAGKLIGDGDVIRVSLLQENGERLLTVSDNGGGKVTGGRQGTGFGTRLVQLLTSQLDGTLREANEGGLRTEIRF